MDLVRQQSLRKAARLDSKKTPDPGNLLRPAETAAIIRVLQGQA